MVLVRILQKVSEPYGSGSTTLFLTVPVFLSRDAPDIRPARYLKKTKLRKSLDNYSCLPTLNKP
jgi:hypothetical protein